jgi:MFS family permease
VKRRPSLESRIGLNAANFFLAEMVGVAIPLLSTFLRQSGWSYETIGIATALSGLAVFLVQTPAGIVVDHLAHRRTLLAAASLVLGVCFGLIPCVPPHWWLIDPLLFCAGAANAFFAPLLGALALGLVGHAALSKTVGVNQGWNHAGNIAAALSAMILATWSSLSSVFVAMAVCSILAAASVFIIRGSELNSRRASGVTTNGDGPSHSIGLWELLKDRRVLILFVSTALFHLANAPVMPLVALYVKHLKGTDQQVAEVVLTAQVVMIPVALSAGWLCERWGRKPVFAIGLLVLPLRIFLYTLAHDPQTLVLLQTLDGVGAGIYGVLIVAMCADLTRGKGHFNALSGLIATALAAGGVVGPLVAGILVEHLGFVVALDAFALIAIIAASLFLFSMPETRFSGPGRELAEAGSMWAGPKKEVAIE